MKNSKYRIEGTCLFTLVVIMATWLSACSLTDEKPIEGQNHIKQKGLLEVPSPDVHSVELSADFTVVNKANKYVYDFFDVAVRTHKGSPKSVPATFGRTPKVNTVRMLGGWRSKNINADTYKWNGSEYVYDFAQSDARLDQWLDNDWDIFQIVLDNPPWAFQRGYHLVDQSDGVNYLKKDANAVYGNSLPPNDSLAWNRYIQAFITHLIERYGKEKVLSWRFRVGSEIDTRPQHWSATRQEFFDHYKNTVNAVHAVLPAAKIGAHFREASFKGRYIDYTGNTEDAYATHFLTWAKTNKVHYDFVAISYYPHVTKPHEMDMDAVYAHDIEPILEHPDWDDNARFEIHEFKFIIKMKRGGFESVATSHSAAFFAMLSKMMLEKNIKDVYQWGNARNGHFIPEALTQLALYSMLGKEVYTNDVTKRATKSGHLNTVDGIFTASKDKRKLDVLLFNFNRFDMSYQAPETTLIKLKIDKPAGTSFSYRFGVIDQNSVIDQRFYQDFPQALMLESQGGWRKAGVHETASAMSLLNEQGKNVFLENKNKYGKSDDLVWGDWQTAEVFTDKNGGTWVELSSTLSSFSVQKLEVRFASNHI